MRTTMSRLCAMIWLSVPLVLWSFDAMALQPAAPMTTVPPSFPIAITSGREQAFSSAFDGTNFLVGIQGNATHSASTSAQLVSQAGTLVGPRISIGRSGGVPLVAFHGTKYLMVWPDDAISPTNILYGQFVSTSGSLLGSAFSIAPLGLEGENDLGGLAFGGGSYLVVYDKKDTVNPSYHKVYGCLVSEGGSVGSEFVISAGYGKQGFGNVAFDGSRFLVVWTDDLNDTEVKGRFVSPTGTLGTQFTINASAFPSDNPVSVVFGGTKYLVVWPDEVGGYGTGEWDLFGQLVDTSGSLVGGVMAIATRSGQQWLAFPAFDGSNYFVAWADYSNDLNSNGLCDPGEGSCADVYARYVSQAGQTLGTELPLIADPGNQVISPPLFAAGSYFLVWNLFDTFEGVIGDVYGTFLAPAATNQTATVTCLTPNGGFDIDGENFTVLTQGQTAVIAVRPTGSLVRLWSCGWDNPSCQWLPYTFLPHSVWEIVSAGGARIVMSAVDYDGDGFDTEADCDDHDPSVHPGATEVCNGRDDNCDGIVDNGAGSSCDDGNPCTDDSCDPKMGCVHANNEASCDDGNSCTTDDSCSAGVCVGTRNDCVIAVNPPNNATDVSVSTNVTLSYQDPIIPETVTASTFRLIGPDEAAIPAARFVSSDGAHATLDPTDALEPNTTYRVEATSEIIDWYERPTQPFTSYFRTGEAATSATLPNVSEPTSPLPALAKGGSSVSAAGDLNGDGVQDAISGAPGYGVAGAALVYLGSGDAAERAQPDIIFTGVSAHDRVGVSVAGDFDFNGDGRKDIVIGAEQVDRTTTPNTPTPTGNGKVYLVFFDPNDTVHYPNLANPAVPDTVSLALVGQPGGIPGVVFTGVGFGDQAGFSVAGGGTSSLGGGTDIIIGAPGADPGGRTDAGAAYVVFDNPNLSGDISLTRISSGLPDQVPGKAYLGSAPGDNLGFSTAFVAPLVVGLTETTGTVVMGAPGANGSKGKVIGPPDDPDTTPIIVDAIGTTQSGFQIGGTQDGEQLGFSVASGGDSQEDGVPDLLIGAPTYDDTTPLRAGFALQANAGRVIQMSQVLASGVYDADAVGTTIRGRIWLGAAAEDQLGFAVAGVSDVTGDGFDDIVLGAPFVDPIVGGVLQPNAGAVYLVEGSPATGYLGSRNVADVGTTIAGQRLTGTQAGEHAGSSLAGTGDLSGDGRNDFAVGAPNKDADSGTVYMVLRETSPVVGNCGPEGCRVADLATGAEVVVPAGGLTTTLDITVTGILDGAALPAPVPAGRILLGAARFTPDGQTVLSPFAAIYLPTSEPLRRSLASGGALPLFYFDGVGWVPAGIDGTLGANPSYPSMAAVAATAGAFRTYAVFVDDCFNVNCDDGNPCTDDACIPGGTCNHTNNVSPCDDGDPATSSDVCQGGVCVGSTCSAQPRPKSSGYYKKLCKDGHGRPSHSDALTAADAVCVGQLTATFAGISTVEDLCAVVDHDSHGTQHDTNGPNGKECLNAEAELMVLALNICREYVCESQEVDSQCSGEPHDHTLTTVAASLAATDALLADPARNKTTCKDAKCLAKEVNNGHGLHHTSLLLDKEAGNKVRLRWNSPVMDDGSGEASGYTIWRRALNADAAFVRIGVTSQTTFDDNGAATGNFEYEVTFTIEP